LQMYNSLLLCHLVFPDVIYLLGGHWLPIVLSDTPCLSGAKCYSVSSSFQPHLSSIQMESTALMYHCDGLRFPSTLFTKCSVISHAVQVYLLHVVTLYPLLCNIVDYVAHALA
jgi:hypothetical protein